MPDAQFTVSVGLSVVRTRSRVGEYTLVTMISCLCAGVVDTSGESGGLTPRSCCRCLGLGATRSGNESERTRLKRTRDSYYNRESLGCRSGISQAAWKSSARAGIKFFHAIASLLFLSPRRRPRSGELARLTRLAPLCRTRGFEIRRELGLALPRISGTHRADSLAPAAENRSS